jgi:DNA-binding transcriptional ArsR family regulator
MSPEPRFSRIAAQIADPTRARMLGVLLSGQARSAGELARVAGITPQAASTQLAQLVDSALVTVRSQGRHKYFALVGADVAHALEALAVVAEGDAVSSRWSKPAYRHLKCARRCYAHMAGELAVAQYDMLLRCNYLQARPTGYALSPAGQDWAAALGLDLPAAASKTRLAYPCMDWSERREHLAGTLATALLQHHLAQDWLRADSQSRALMLTPKGQRELLPWLAATQASQ